MLRVLSTCAALCCLALAGCGNSVEDIEPAPVAQLQGPWQMVNRMPNCENSYLVISPVGFHKLAEKAQPKKYFSISKFTLAPGQITLLTKGVGRDPEEEVSLVFSLVENRLRLLDIVGPKDESFKEPPANLEAPDQHLMRSIYRINEQRFALDKCVGA